MSIEDIAADYARDKGLTGDAEVIGGAAKVLKWCLENGYFTTEMTDALAKDL